MVQSRPRVKESPAPRLLIVEDHRYLGGLLRDVLPQAGFEVALVPGTGELPAALDGFVPDVILADFRLQGEDGLDVCRLIRAHPRAGGVPIVLHTAVDPEDRRLQEALALPGVSLLLKPADYQILVAVLRQQIGRRAGPSGA